ncbi:MAG: hypothetical protein QMD12_03115 [Candidatus Aenigmarchaeota archaeon]|nr:hypothetical protein [Candidatus Aenigmarchaeota archaeon]
MKGLVVSTVGWLILAIVAVIVLFIFFSKLVPVVGEFMDAAVKGLKKLICDMLPWPLNWLAGC